jgi:hypothetical protein
MTGESKKTVEFEIAVIYSRAKLLRLSIILTTFSAVASSLLIVSLFITALLGIETLLLYGVFFAIALACLVVGLIFFLFDVNDGLTALEKEFERGKK